MSGKLFIKPGDLEISFPAIVGQKALDISILPIRWVPSYFVISSNLFENWKKIQTISGLIGKDDLSELKLLIESLQHSEKKQLIVRSSSSDEGMRQRGKYLSQEIIVPNIEQLLVGINKIFLHAHQGNSKTNDDFRLALIVQELKHTIHRGHLSNEKRVARRIQDWLYQFDTGKGEVGNFAIKSHYQNANPGNQLKAHNFKELINTLRDVATYFDDLHQRLHLEWVWDGSNLWIVQGDQDVNSIGTSPTKFLTPSFPIKRDYKFQILKNWSEADQTKWDKISNQFQFKQARLPTYPIWVLEDANVLEKMANAKFPTPILNDLNQLGQYPIVIRTDINKKIGHTDETLNLPRSDTLNSIEKIQEFISIRAKIFLKRYSPEDFCFILHQYIPCKSSAFSLSRKDNPRISIDAIWGIADGLQYFPHDTFEYDTSIGTLIRDDPDFKEKFLAPDPKGDWQYVYSGSAWDWKSSLSPKEIHEISMGSVALSKLLKKDLVTMWFVGIPPNTNIPAIIPWWSKESKDITNIVSPSDKSVFNRKIELISLPSDLDKLESIPLRQDVALKLNPGPELLRSKEFINKIIHVAKTYDLPVEMCGSPLSHAYYLLQNAGVKISCEGRLYRKSKIFKTKVSEPKTFDKLVRDKIPQIISAHGEQVSTRKVSENDLVQALKRKTIEEAYELFRTDNETDVREELSDLYEVMMTLASIYKITPEMIKTSAKKKKTAKGGFKDGVYLLQTLEIPLLPEEDGRTLFTENLLGIVPKPINIPEFKNRQLTIPVIPPPIQTIKIKLPENVAQCDNQSIYLLIKYENTKISVEFIATSKTKQGSKLIT